MVMSEIKKLFGSSFDKTNQEFHLLALDADIGNKTERFLCVYPRKGYLHSGRNSIRFPLSQKEGGEYSLNQM